MFESNYTISNCECEPGFTNVHNNHIQEVATALRNLASSVPHLPPHVLQAHLSQIKNEIAHYNLPAISKLLEAAKELSQYRSSKSSYTSASIMEQLIIDTIETGAKILSDLFG